MLLSSAQSMVSMAGPATAFVGIFSGVVVLHETGHFLAAKRYGIPVAEFSIGFPSTPVLWTFWRYRKTAFTLRLLPFGGFVSFVDAGDSDNREEDSGPFRHCRCF